MKKQFTAQDLGQMTYLSHPVLSLDGKKIAYVASHAEEAGGTFPRKIWLYDLDCGTQKCLTEGDCSEKLPCFTADGQSMLYLSDASGEFQVYIRNLHTGVSRQITTLRHGVLRYSLSNDDQKIAFEATLWPEDIENGNAFTEMTPEQKTQWEEELDWRPYYITNLTYKLDDWYGMRKGEFSHIGTANLDGTQPCVLNTNGMEATYPAWSNDGAKLAFYGYPYDGPKGRFAEVFCCDADGNELCQLTSGPMVWPDAAPLFTKDDSCVICNAYPSLPDGGTSLLPYRVNISTKEMTLLLDADDEAVCHGINPLVSSRTVHGDFASYFYLSADGNTLYFLSALKGQTCICSVPVWQRGNAQLVQSGDTDIVGFYLGRNNEIVCIMGSWQNPGDLWYRGNLLTDCNAWLREYAHGQVESIWIKGRDGKTDLQYFLMHPVNQEPGKKYPAVLDIKGGPTTMYAAAYWHEFHALAAQDFAVIYGNPRGSTGFGHGFCAGPICWKPEAMEDLLDMVEDAISRGFIDREHIGVTGGSYGGYMTNKLIGRTQYFSAAVTQRCLINPAVSYGTGDQGFIRYGELPKDFTMLDYLEDRAKGNLITYIDNMKLPVLILHGYKDYRCGFEQAEQMFIAMKDRHPDIPVRLVVFPEENHSVTRIGKLHSQVCHLSELVGWFCKYLKGEDTHD